MSNEIVLDTPEILAPSVHGNFTLVDSQLASEIQKIPDQLAFKIGDVADIAGLKSYVLRYWETEFEALRPKKSKHNQRVYSKKDVELVLIIKKLLYRDRYSIEGARTALRKNRREMKHVGELSDAHTSSRSTHQNPNVDVQVDIQSEALLLRVGQILDRIERLKGLFT